MDGVLFQVNVATPLTQDGRFVAIVGNVPSLGSWDIAQAVRLKKIASSSTLWEGSFALSTDVVIEYKYVILDQFGQLVLWESLPGNRTLMAGATNVALQKPCAQSSIFVAQAPPVFGPRVPELAVNGNTSGHFESMCCRTNQEDQPFWQVDLQTQTPLSALVVWNRQDMFLERLVPFWILVSSEPFESASLEDAKSQAIECKRFDHVAARYEWPIKIQARYVRVQHENMQTTLQFAQFQAFSTTNIPTPIQDGWFGFDSREHGDSLTHIDGQWLAPSSKPELRLIFGSFDKKPSLTLKNKSTQQMHLQIRVVSNMESTIHHPFSASLGAIDTTQTSSQFDREITGNLFPLSNATASSSSTVDLHQISLLSGLKDDVLKELQECLEDVQLTDGQQIFAIAQERRHLYVVKSGKLLIQGPTTTEGTHTFLTLHPSNYYGEFALISGTHRNVQVVASGATECVRLHRADFQRVLANHGIPLSSLLEAYMHDVSSKLPLLTTLPEEKSPFRHLDALQVFRLQDIEPTSSIVVDVIETSTNNLVGSAIVSPSQLHKTNGALSTPLFTSTTNVVGEILLRYVKIKPFSHELNGLQKAQRTQWFHGSPSDMGHRGLGRSYYQALGFRMSHIRENTMSSFVVAGYHGADWIEFDVQLSQDRIPVIYHDFFFKAALEDRRGRSGGFTKTGLHDLTLAQLNAVEWRHGKHMTDVPRFKQLVLKHWFKIVKKPIKPSTTKVPARPSKDYSWMKLSEQFPTLENLLKTVPPYVGLNIEIKYPVDPPHAPFLRELACFEMNAYLDDILKVVLEHSNGRRNIVFSCFDPDVCVMLRVKQTQYPVFFLTCGYDLSGKVPDVRTLSLETAVPFSRMEQLQGIVTNSLPLFSKPELIRAIRNDQLKLWTWGDYNTGHSKVQFQKKYGVHGVISDNVGDLTKKDGKIRPRDILSTVS